VNNVFASLSKLALLLGLCTVGIPTSDAHSREKGKGKAKGSQHVAAKEKHGRDAGNLPFGIGRHTKKKGELPSGLQKKKDEDGSLTRGLEEGGKRVTSVGKGKKGSK
jgi:hypothetical protein